VIYSPRSEDDPAEPNVARRITHRWDPIPVVQKVLIRIDDASLGRVALGQGNHSAMLDGKDIDLPLSAAVGLAHFYRRTVAQESLKAVLGRLRAIASPDGALCSHYQPMYDRVKADPLLWLLGPSGDHSRPMVREPIVYRGGPLAHTPAVDDSPARFIRVLIEHAELQANLQRELLRKFDPGEGLLASEMLRLEPVF
jgi:hypothetical protein